MSALRHFRDPCVHCGLGHDDVAPGPCLGDPLKRAPMAYQYMGTRWDFIARFVVEMSDGTFTDWHAHISTHPDCGDGWLADARRDTTVFRRSGFQS